jgi:hypothetical protein
MSKENTYQKLLNWHPNIILYAILAIAALMLSLPFSFGSWIPLAILSVLIYIFILFNRPDIGFAIAFVVIMVILGTTGNRFLRVQGYFRLLDVIFIILFLSFIKEVIYKSDLRLLIKSPISKAILLFMGSAVVAGIYTKFHYNVSLISIFQAGRVYLYYSFFFLTLYHLRNKKQLHFFLKIILLTAILFSVVYIGGELMGKNYRILYGSVYRTISSDDYGVTRMRNPAGSLPGLVLPAMLAIAIFSSSRRVKHWSMVAVILLLAETILNLGRAYWFGVGVSVLIICLLLPPEKRKLVIRYLPAMSIFLIVLILIISITSDSSFALISIVKDRADSAFKDFFYRTGTFGWRYRLAEGYMHLLKERPVFGFGLLHRKYGNLIPEVPKGKVRNIHVGILNIFIDLGIFGSIFFIIFVLTVIYRSIYIYKRIQSWLYKAIVLGIIATFIGRFTAFTLDVFTSYQDVCIIAILLGLMEVMYTLDKEAVHDSQPGSKRPILTRS